MTTTGLHSNAQQQTEGTSKSQIEQQAKRVVEASALLALETVQLGIETARLAAKTLKFVLSIFHKLKLFLKNTQQAAGKFVREGIPNKIQSLKDYLNQETEGAVKIGQEIKGKEQEQAEKFIKLLNTPVGEQAPAGLENTTIAPWGENLITVDRNDRVTVNLIQPLMDSEVVQAAIDRDLVQSAVAPGIQPILGSLTGNEAEIQSSLIANDAIAKITESQLDVEIYPEVAALISEQEEVNIAPKLPLVTAELPQLIVGNDGVVEDLFKELETFSERSKVELELPVAEVENEPEVSGESAEVTVVAAPELVKANEQRQEERNQRRIVELLANARFTENLALIAKLHQEYKIEQYVNPDRANAILYPYGAKSNVLVSLVERDGQRQVDIIEDFSSGSASNRAYILKDGNGEYLMSFNINNNDKIDIKPDQYTPNLNVNQDNIAKNSLADLSLVSSIADMMRSDKQSSWQIIEKPGFEPDLEDLKDLDSFRPDLAEKERQRQVSNDRIRTARATSKALPKLPEITPPQPDFVPVSLTLKLRGELTTIAQLHQVGTTAETSSLSLVPKNGADIEAPVIITQSLGVNGAATYTVETQGNVDRQRFNFTIDDARIITNFNLDRQSNPDNIHNLIKFIANVLAEPEHTDFQPHPESNLREIETLQQLNTTLRELETATEKPTSSAEVTIDDRKFGVRTIRRKQTVIVTDKATSKTMTFGKQGIEDGGLLQGMMKGAKDGSLFASKFIQMAQEKANRIKTIVDNATPQILEVINEGVNRDRAGKEAASKAIESLGAQIEGFVSAVQTTMTPSPAMAGTVGEMRRIEQVFELIDDNEVEVDMPELNEVEARLQQKLIDEAAQKVTLQVNPLAKAQSRHQHPSL